VPVLQSNRHRGNGGRACRHAARQLTLARLASPPRLAIAWPVETLSLDNLRAQSKHQNAVRDYRRVIDALHRHGLAVAAGTMFGFDHDDPGVFERTVFD
jgi:hypothetical protein